MYLGVNEMKIVTLDETKKVNGGILFVAPVVGAMFADTAIYGTLISSYGIGYGIGAFVNDNIGAYDNEGAWIKYPTSGSGSGGSTITYTDTGYSCAP